MASPNICYAPSFQTGRNDDWILSTGSLQVKNIACGIQLDASSATGDPSFWSNLRWQRLGAVPAISSMGKSVVGSGSLFMIGGHCSATQKLSSTIHVRKINERHSQPIPTSPMGQTLFGDSLGHYQMACNNHFPMCRLGFPLPEHKLFPEDGSRVLRLLPPTVVSGNKSTVAVRHCEQCLWRSHSVDRAREERCAALYYLQSFRWLGGRGLCLCSQCLCEI